MQPSSTTTATIPVAHRKTHPIRGILWGIMLGLGAAVIAILLKIIPFELVWALIVLAGGVVVGILWSTLGPARKPKGAPPWHADQVTHRPDWDAAAAPEALRRGSGSTLPAPQGAEPVLIQPLDIEPLDLGPPAMTDVPADAGSGSMPAPVAGSRSESELADPVPDPPRTMDPPDRSQPPPPPPV